MTHIATAAETRALINMLFAVGFADTGADPVRGHIEALVQRDGTPTLAAVSRLPGAAGDKTLMLTGTNVVLYGGLSLAAISALVELQLEGAVRFVPTIPMTYLVEGVSPALPLAVPGRSYATEHWLPVVLMAA